MNPETRHHIPRPAGHTVSALHRPGRGPTVVFLPGLRSDMRGEKASMLSDRAGASGRAMLRLDYSGHGESGGAFTDGGIETWGADAAAAIEALAPGPLVLVGSSMGGWIALLLARSLGNRVRGLVGIAAAPDFTDEVRAGLGPIQLEALARGETAMLPAEPDPLPVTRRFLDEGDRSAVMRAPLPIRCPVRLLHGLEDAVVPWRRALEIGAHVETEDCRCVLVKGGDHRLSRPADLELLRDTVAALAGD